MEYPKICPNCGSNLICIYRECDDSYHLECKSNSKCFYQDCSKEQYKEYEHKMLADEITPYEQEVLDGILNADDDTDYYHHWR